MKKLKKSSSSRIILKRSAIIAVSFAVIFLVSVPLTRQMRQGRLIDEQIEKLEKEIEEMNSRNESLKKMITFLESDEYAEEQARLQLGFKKEGEEVVSIKGLEDSADPAAAAGENIIEARVAKKNEVIESNPEKWRRYFFGNF